MKKHIILILLAGLLCFVACEKTDTTPAQSTDTSDNTIVTETSTEPETTQEITIDSAYSLTLSDGTNIFIGASADHTLSALGKPLETLEAPSCIHEGMDCVYTFDGFTLLASPDGKGNQIIAEFAITSDVVSLENGLTIGSDKTEVENTFGTEYTEQFGVLRYALDGVDVSVVLDGNSAVSNLVVALQ